jgi:hypothetical protein
MNDIISAILTKKATDLEPSVSKIIVDNWDFEQPENKRPELNASGTIYVKRPEGNVDRKFKNSTYYVEKWLGPEFMKNMQKMIFRNQYLRNIGMDIPRNTNMDPQSLSKVSFKIEFED